MQDIKPGMTRKDVVRVFTTEGGLSNRQRRTYVFRGCPYIKVDVEFNPVGGGDPFLTENSADTIREISKPYLEWFHSD